MDEGSTALFTLLTLLHNLRIHHVTDEEARQTLDLVPIKMAMCSVMSKERDTPPKFCFQQKYQKGFLGARWPP